MAKSILPEYSRAAVNAAGRRIRKELAEDVDFKIVENWRGSHAHILNAFQTTLRNKRTDTSVIVQRLKRLPTIIDKLVRRPTFSLTEMQDIAGCRIILPTVDEVTAFRDSFLRSRISHEHLSLGDRYNYIKSPKPDGYRSIHEVFAYKSRKVAGLPWQGLRVELQLRTNVQHAWATAVEVAGFLTENDPKFGRGSPLYAEFFTIASELLARHHEEMVGPLPSECVSRLKVKLLEIDQEIGIMSMFKKFNQLESQQLPQFGSSVMLLIRPLGDLEAKTRFKKFDSFAEALRTIGDFERPGSADEKFDVVVVRNVAGGFLTNAYRNYFSDTKDFVALINTCLD